MEREVCVVVVTLDAPLEYMPALLSHASLGIERFPEYAGFRSGTLHVSLDGTRLIQYLEWDSESEYEQCVSHPGWDDLDSTRRFMETVEHPDVLIDARAYRVLRRSEGETPTAGTTD